MFKIISKIISKTYYLILKLGIVLTRLRKKRFNRIYESCEDKAICELHKDDWIPLSRSERKKYRQEEYTYTFFKNTIPDFEQVSDYLVSEREYITEILPRISKVCRKEDGTPIWNIFNDKNFFDRLFPDIRFPVTIVRNIKGIFYDGQYREISREEAIDRLSGYEKVVFKKTVDTEHGAGVVPAAGDKIIEAFEAMGENFIVQEIIKQHSFLADFNSSSVNVIRIISIFWKGKSYILDSRLRVGAPGSFCDHQGFDGVGCLGIGISEEGKLCGEAFEYAIGKFHPTIFGKKIEGFIPAYGEMLDIAKKEQAIYQAYGILGWDFTVAEDGGVVCIEVNSRWPATKAAQIINGPIFMKKTDAGIPLLDDILRETLPF